MGGFLDQPRVPRMVGAKRVKVSSWRAGETEAKKFYEAE